MEIKVLDEEKPSKSITTYTQLSQEPPVLTTPEIGSLQTCRLVTFSAFQDVATDVASLMRDMGTTDWQLLAMAVSAVAVPHG